MNEIPVFRLILLLLVLVAVGVGFTCVYTLSETEQAVVTYFGDPLRTVVEPGLHFKGPFFWRVHRFDKRVLEWDGSPDQVPTKDKRYIWVDVFARWRITDPLRFFQSVNNELEAQGRLDDIIDGATRDLITENNLIEVVRSSERAMEAPEYGIDVEAEVIPKVTMGREKIQDLILEKARGLMEEEFGIELVDVQIKRINYVQEVSEKVYERMISERLQVAALFVAEGRELATQVGMDADSLEQHMRDGQYDDFINGGNRQAQEAGVSGVPAVLINGRFVAKSSRSEACLSQLIEEELQGAKAEG